jgi:hypothetical protein
VRDYAKNLEKELERQRREVRLRMTQKWQSDRPDCSMCKTAFTFFTRPHHCRNCGHVFCHECSKDKMEVAAYPTKQRVCSKCFEERDRVVRA